MIERYWAELDDARIHYRRAGAGEPVVLIHGLSASGRWWSRNIDALAEHFEVYVIDLLGFGDSRGQLPFVLSEAAGLLARWMDALELKAAHIVGHSMGGYIAAHFAADYPERVLRLVLVDAAVPLPDDGRWEHARHLNRELRYTPLRFLHLLATDAIRAGPLTIWRAANQLMTAELYDELAHITAPTLLVWGENDPLVPPSVGDRLRQLIPHAELVTIPDCGHKPMLEHPDDFNEAVIAFLLGAGAGNRESGSGEG